jgi:starch phosphorylase
MDEYGYGWDEAWDVVSHTIAYTNHTVMPEALERWPVQYVQQLLPRIYMIIEEINRRFNLFLNEKGISSDKRYAMQIIKDGQIHMTNMAIYAGFSVNGVAKLHTQILETTPSRISTSSSRRSSTTRPMASPIAAGSFTRTKASPI